MEIQKKYPNVTKYKNSRTEALDIVEKGRGFINE